MLERRAVLRHPAPSSLERNAGHLLRLAFAVMFLVFGLQKDGVAGGPEGKQSLHLQVAVAHPDGTAVGGYLLEAHVRPTLEAVLTESPQHLRKQKGPEGGLALVVPQG